jgi:hypothetical protein
VVRQTAAQLGAIAPFNGCRIVPRGLLGKDRPADASGWPAIYLAAVHPQLVSINTEAAGHSTRTYDFMMSALILVNSDGRELGDAQMDAWDLAADILDGIINFVPVITTAAVEPVDPGTPEDVFADIGQAGIHIPLTCRMTWTI